MLRIKKVRISGYEQVCVGRDPARNLSAIIAVHSTRLGPALGGIRMFPYRSERDALKDALKLAQAMTYKAAVSGLELGGGKAVLIGDPLQDKTRDLFLALGEFIHELKGAYIAAEDSGINAEDLNIVSQRTPYVTGTTTLAMGSGDPSPATAWGVLVGIEACLREVWGQISLKGRTVAIQGLGQVGFELAKRLHQRGAILSGCDISKRRLAYVTRFLPIKIVSPETIHKVKADVFSPCALGAVLSRRTIREIKARIVAGGANNQFEDETRDPVLLMRRGILHAPDYVINAGGLIQLYVKEILKKKDLGPWIERIGSTLARIFLEAKHEKSPPLRIARRMAEARLRKKRTA